MIIQVKQEHSNWWVENIEIWFGERQRRQWFTGAGRWGKSRGKTWLSNQQATIWCLGQLSRCWNIRNCALDKGWPCLLNTIMYIYICMYVLYIYILHLKVSISWAAYWMLLCKVIHLDLVNSEFHITSIMPGSEIRTMN